MADPLFSVNIQGSRKSIAALDVAQILYLLIEIEPPPQRDAARLPLNLCIVIDSSSSMKGERLDHVRTAVKAVLEEMLAGDVLSLVAFNDSAEIILPPQKIISSIKIEPVLKKITASGGSELGSGLQTGITQLSTSNLETHNNQLILITGAHTYGSESSCANLAEKAAADGIEFSTFGIGSEWNDRFLDRLVSFSGGQSVYIDSPGKLDSSLEQRVESIGRNYAKNVRMIANFTDEITLKSAVKVNPFAQQLSVQNGQLNFGGAEEQKPLTVLLEFVISPIVAKNSLSVPILLVADLPSLHIKDRTHTQKYDLEVLDNNPLLQPSEYLLHAVQAMNFHRMNELAWQEIKVGAIEKATSRLHNLATRLLEQSKTEMAQRLLSEADRLMTWGSMSGEGRKALKYGTRALMEQSRTDEHQQ